MVLALLRERDMHTYEMARLLRQRRDDRLISITNGTLYHTVSRLNEQGLLAEVGTDREGNRPERTTYTLTSAGADAVGDWVRRELGRLDHPARFRVAVAEAHNLDRAEVIALLEQRRALVQEDLAHHEEGIASAAERRIPEQYILEITRQRMLLQADLDWLDQLLPRLGDPAFAWGADPDHCLAERKAHE
ncbi:PadR family transcriptional regulator [Microbacterium resistens]|uniref:PadR family transcriptional regulator n=2 Tax=Microbacteriaceae TaxID=85023 RepID=A0ABY3RXE7_9MICO|nr:PadR family transcriptional regulator [Microbacterium resistens]UGS28551.1 PadR family transcriptional regulator [Microbacterium resistens]